MDFKCQLDILKERGLTIEDEEDAIKLLVLWDFHKSGKTNHCGL